MPWRPLSHVPPAGECILLRPGGSPVESNPHFPRRNGGQDEWFLDARDLDPRRPCADSPPASDSGWVVIDRSPLHPQDPGLAIVCTSLPGAANWARTTPAFATWRWAPLPAWPDSAHARLAALESLGFAP